MSGADASADVINFVYVTSFNDNTITIYSTATGQAVSGPISVGAAPWTAAITPDGQFVYVTTAGADAVDVIGPDGTVIASIAVGLTPLALTLAPDGRTLYVANRSSNSLSVVDVATNTVVTTIPAGSAPSDVAVTPDGLHAYVTNQSANTVTVIDLTSQAIIMTVPTGQGPTALAITPDGLTVYVANTNADTLTVIDTVGNTVSGSPIPTGPSPSGIAITPAGNIAYVANNATAQVQAFNLVNRTVIANIPLVTAAISLAITPDGRTVWVKEPAANLVETIDTATNTVSGTISVASFPVGGGQFIGPNIIVDDGGPLSIAGDADLTAHGFRSSIIFDGGTLQLSGALSTARSILLLAGGGTIDTHGFEATVGGSVGSSGGLSKNGAGRLRLTGAAAQSGGSVVNAGTLEVDGAHPEAVVVQGGTLAGVGTVGAVTVLDGSISPGQGGAGILHASQVQLLAGTALVVELNGPVAGTGYDRLDVTGAAVITGATMSLQLGYTPAGGSLFTILTHATGTFAGLAEGAAFTVGGRRFRITYQGGSGSDVVLLADELPTISAFSNRTIAAGAAFDPIAFTVADDATPASSLVVTATSSNTTLVPDANLVLGGTGAARTLGAAPVLGVAGSTTITVTVADGAEMTQASFVLTVDPAPTYYLAEGATGAFFDTDILIANPHGVTAPVTVTFLKDDGTTIVRTMDLGPTSRTTIRASGIDGLQAASFSVSVATGVPLVVERTMWWDASRYGSHGEKANAGAAADWYFAEGSQGYFHTYFLLVNPQSGANTAHVSYLLEGGATVLRDYPLAAASRTTIDVGGEPELANRSFGARVTFDMPGMAERAMYFGSDPIYSGGHDSSGVTAPSTTWLLAEGATGSFFDTYILIANPGPADANVTMTYLTPDGLPVTRLHVVATHQRLTINVALEAASLESAAVSSRVDSDQPVVVERSMYWPKAQWIEAHNSAGETNAGTRWGLAEGRVGGTAHAQTYILLENPGAEVASVTATFLRTSGPTVVKSFVLAPASRMNISVTGAGSHVPELADEEFGTVILSSQPIFVERSLYTDANGVTWAAGTSVTATRLP